MYCAHEFSPKLTIGLFRRGIRHAERERERGRERAAFATEIVSLESSSSSAHLVGMAGELVAECLQQYDNVVAVFDLHGPAPLLHHHASLVAVGGGEDAGDVSVDVVRARDVRSVLADLREMRAILGWEHGEDVRHQVLGERKPRGSQEDRL